MQDEQQISMRLRASDLHELKELILRKYGGLRGAMKAELNRAIANHILLLKSESESRNAMREKHDG